MDTKHVLLMNNIKHLVASISKKYFLHIQLAWPNLAQVIKTWVKRNKMVSPL